MNNLDRIVMAHNCNPNTQEAKMGGSEIQLQPGCLVSLRPVFSRESISEKIIIKIEKNTNSQEMDIKKMNN